MFGLGIAIRLIGSTQKTLDSPNWGSIELSLGSSRAPFWGVGSSLTDLCGSLARAHGPIGKNNLNFKGSNTLPLKKIEHVRLDSPSLFKARACLNHFTRVKPNPWVLVRELTRLDLLRLLIWSLFRCCKIFYFNYINCYNRNLLTASNLYNLDEGIGAYL